MKRVQKQAFKVTCSLKKGKNQNQTSGSESSLRFIYSIYSIKGEFIAGAVRVKPIRVKPIENGYRFIWFETYRWSQCNVRVR